MFVKKLRPFLSLYKAMQNCFENEDIVNILNENFRILFDKIENYFLANGVAKPEDENIFKQYLIK
jgi:DNA-binding ferritin-like protein (Dps family)